jgi:hypothetical protein
MGLLEGTWKGGFGYVLLAGKWLRSRFGVYLCL